MIDVFLDSLWGIIVDNIQEDPRNKKSIEYDLVLYQFHAMLTIHFSHI